MRHDRQAWLWQVCVMALGAFLVIGRTASLSAASTTPYLGTPAAIPGQINAQNFDNGGEGVAYHDTTAGNSGGQFRSTDVDIEQSSEGAYDVGWIAAGEWLNYTVNVATAGTYSFSVRVASPGIGGTFHLEMAGSNVSGAIKPVSKPLRPSIAFTIDASSVLPPARLIISANSLPD